jgi:hypothetical protein
VVSEHAVLENLQAAGDHRAHEDRQAHDGRREVREVVEIRERLEPDRGSGGRDVFCGGDLQPDLVQRALEDVERGAVRVVSDEGGHGAGT